MDHSNDGEREADPLKQCGYCGTELWENVWYPVHATSDDDGTTLVLSFCSDACKGAWMNDEETAAPADP